MRPEGAVKAVALAFVVAAAGAAVAQFAAGANLPADSRWTVTFALLLTSLALGMLTVITCRVAAAVSSDLLLVRRRKEDAASLNSRLSQLETSAKKGHAELVEHVGSLAKSLTELKAQIAAQERRPQPQPPGPGPSPRSSDRKRHGNLPSGATPLPVERPTSDTPQADELVDAIHHLALQLPDDTANEVRRTVDLLRRRTRETGEAALIKFIDDVDALRPRLGASHATVADRIVSRVEHELDVGCGVRAVVREGERYHDFRDQVDYVVDQSVPGGGVSGTVVRVQRRGYIRQNGTIIRPATVDIAP